jgi:hypothetical protein
MYTEHSYLQNFSVIRTLPLDFLSLYYAKSKLPPYFKLGHTVDKVTKIKCKIQIHAASAHLDIIS